MQRLAVIFILLAATLATASPVQWSALGLDQAQITGAGQTISDFNGVTGLTVVITGSDNTVAPYVHVNGNLHLRSTIGSVGSIPPSVITFAFSQPVLLSMNMTHFGDGYIRERITFDSHGTGIFVGSIGAGGAITGQGSDLLEFLSADTYVGSPASVTAPGVSALTVVLDGADGNDIAGVTLGMDLEPAAVAAVDATWSDIKALFR
mgnify:FL=1